MKTSSNENIFRVTGPLCGEFIGHQWIPLTRPVTRSFDLRLNKRLSKQSWGWWFETPSRSLWRHCNAIYPMLQAITRTNVDSASKVFCGTHLRVIQKKCSWTEIHNTCLKITLLKLLPPPSEANGIMTSSNGHAGDLRRQQVHYYVRHCNERVNGFRNKNLLCTNLAWSHCDVIAWPSDAISVSTLGEVAYCLTAPLPEPNLTNDQWCFLECA